MTITYQCEGTSDPDSNCSIALDYNKLAVKNSTGVLDALSATIPGSTISRVTHSWTSVVDTPNDADWPNGTYTFQIRIGQLGITSYFGRLRRVNTSCILDELMGNSTVQTATGTFRYDLSIDPIAGLIGDRIQGLIIGDNSLNSMQKNIRANVNVTDNKMFLEGPWEDVGDPSGPVAPAFPATLMAGF